MPRVTPSMHVASKSSAPGFADSNIEEDVPVSAADTLLNEELPAWIEQLSEEVLSVYRATDVGKADGGQPMKAALRDYFAGLLAAGDVDHAETRARLAALYARAGLDLSAHFEMSSRLFALLAERAAVRWHKHSERLARALVEVQRRLWDDARLVADRFVHERERHVGQLVKQLSIAHSELVKLAHDDPLTGVRNRAYLLSTLTTELERARRYREHFSILFADLDHFKHVNDDHGHDAGDEILRQVAALLQRGLRPQDVIGRYGGDEFVIGLVRANAPTARRIAERLRVLVERAHLPTPDATPYITLSIGVVSNGAHEASILELIRRADAAMYAAKAQGRNRVRTAAA